MALTRIANNQITDATIVASSKLQDFSISAGKLANNLNYGSNLTITGNLTVNGTSTTLDTVNTLIEDPILLLVKDQTGSAALDIGFVGERGDDTNIAWIWDEGSSQFAAGFTSSDGSANTITISSYADLRAADITAVGISLSGNVTGPLNVTGAIEASTSITAGTTVTATGNVSGGNLTTAGQVAADNADITNGITAGTTITATGNVSGGNVTTGGAVEATGLISSGSTITATGNVDGGNITTGGAVEETGLISSGTTITATGNVTGGNLVTAGAITDGTATLSSGSITGGVAATFSGAVEGGSVTDGTATISSGAITGATSGAFSTTITATGNVSGGNLTTAAAMDSATINTTGEATLASAIISDLTSGRVVLAGTSGSVEDSANMTFDGSTLGVTGAITSSTTVTATGNITGGNIVTSGSITDGTATLSSGSITGGVAATFSGNVTSANVTVGDVLRIANDGDGLRMTGVGAFDNAGSNIFRIFATNEMRISANGDSGNAIFLNTSNNVTVNNDLAISGNATANNISVTNFVGSNLIPSANATYNLGSATNQWNEVHSAGSTLYLGDLQLKDSGGNTFTVFASDGTTPAEVTGNIAGANVTGAVANATYADSSGTSDTVTTADQPNVTTFSVQDPIIDLGRGANGAPLISDDGKDRGTQLYYYSGSEKSAFVGYDNSEGKIVLAKDVSISSEVVTVSSYGNVVVGGLEAATVSVTGNVDAGNVAATGNITATGNININDRQGLYLYDSDNSNYIAIVSPSTVSGNVTFKLTGDAGTADYVLA